jgi:alpha-L-fucosidase
MKVCGEGIYKTHPWKIYGEDPISAADIVPKEKSSTELNTDKNIQKKKKTQEDATTIRFANTKDGNLYVFLLGVTSKDISIKSLGLSVGLAGKIASIKLVGSTEKIVWKQNKESLEITKPSFFPTENAVAFKVAFAK